MAEVIPIEFERVLNQATALGGRLEEAARYHFVSPGKRERARLALAACESLGVAREPAIDLAVACELVHNASLVHDDLQDGDTLRRGRPSVWHRFGTDVAINLGTALLARAVEGLAGARAPESARNALTASVVRATLELLRGQSADNATTRGRTLALEEYVDIARAKTGPLLALPVEGALRLAGADEGACKSAWEAMCWLGAAFQVQDDLLDLFGAKGRERAGLDLSAGSPSAPLIHFLEIASDPERDEFERWAHTRREDTEGWVERIRSSRAVDISLAQLLSHEREAMGRAAGLPPRLRTVIVQTSRRLLRPLDAVAPGSRAASTGPVPVPIAREAALEARS